MNKNERAIKKIGNWEYLGMVQPDILWLRSGLFFIDKPGETKIVACEKLSYASYWLLLD